MLSKGFIGRAGGKDEKNTLQVIEGFGVLSVHETDLLNIPTSASRFGAGLNFKLLQLMLHLTGYQNERGRGDWVEVTFLIKVDNTSERGLGLW